MRKRLSETFLIFKYLLQRAPDGSDWKRPHVGLNARWPISFSVLGKGKAVLDRAAKLPFD